jgi:hypothetical protein
MGLLDEAIREHLELKRRAGADAIEVARQEREALGPVVRGDPLMADLPPNQPVYEGNQPVYEGNQPVYEGNQPVYQAPPGGPGDPEFYDDDEYEDEFDGPDEQQTAEHAQVPPPPPPPAYYPPARPLADEHHAEPDEADDVLEQTPEFLQETPEHDRLWFEQAPPQEFDFDK